MPGHVQERVEVVVEFHVLMPTDPDLADEKADAVGDEIAAAVNRIGIFDGSAKVTDWKSERVL